MNSEKKTKLCKEYDIADKMLFPVNLLNERNTGLAYFNFS